MFSVIDASPDAKVIIFSTPAPVCIWKPIHFKKLVSAQGSDSSKVAFITQPESEQTWEKKIKDNKTSEHIIIAFFMTFHDLQ